MPSLGHFPSLARETGLPSEAIGLHDGLHLDLPLWVLGFPIMVRDILATCGRILPLGVLPFVLVFSLATP